MQSNQTIKYRPIKNACIVCTIRLMTKNLRNKYLKFKAKRKSKVDDWQFFRLYVGRLAMNSVLMDNGYLKWWLLREKTKQGLQKILFSIAMFSTLKWFSFYLWQKCINQICKLISFLLELMMILRVISLILFNYHSVK